MPEITSSKYLVQAGWDDVPHLDEETRKRYEAETPPYLRDARMKGIPSLGAGAIYPVEETILKIDPIPIPAFWPRVYGLDVGWNKTAAVWGALDRDEDMLYLYAEHYRGQAEPSTHAAAIKARGEWIPGVIDPAANGRQQSDGTRLMAKYEELGLKITKAENSVEAGLLDVWQRMETGRLKVFSTMRNWFNEFRLYRRDEKGKVVKEYDHLMDATRYLCISGLQKAVLKPSARKYKNSQSAVADRTGGY